MSDTANILFLSFLGSVVALVGGVVFLYKKSWSKWLTCHSIPFAAGVLLTVAIVGLLPEAVEALGESAFLVVLLSFLAAYLFEHFVFGIHHHDDIRHGKKYDSVIPLVIVGDTIHNFIDGVVIAASYVVAPGLGVITTISTFLHEVPHEIGDFGILLKAGWKKKKILLVNVVSALMTIVGAYAVILFGSLEFVGVLMAVSAGLFLYLGASDFLPHIHEEDHAGKSSLLALTAGVVIMLGVINLVPHSSLKEENHDGGVEMVVDGQTDSE